MLAQRKKCVGCVIIPGLELACAADGSAVVAAESRVACSGWWRRGTAGTVRRPVPELAEPLEAELWWRRLCEGSCDAARCWGCAAAAGRVAVAGAAGPPGSTYIAE